MSNRFEMEPKKFSAGIRAVSGHSEKLRGLTHALALTGLYDVNFHNNTNKLCELFDAMGPNLARDGLVKWAVAHGKVRFNKGKFEFVNRKDISVSPDAFMESAEKTPYWEFSASNKPKDLSPFDVSIALAQIQKEARRISEGKSKKHKEVQHAELLVGILALLEKFWKASFNEVDLALNTGKADNSENIPVPVLKVGSRSRRRSRPDPALKAA